MPNIHIVTDSGARFPNPRLIEHYPVTILPNHIEISGHRYKEGLDLDTEAALRLISQQKAPPKIIPPSISDFAETFIRLSYHCDAVISIHPSRELSDSWHHGRRAAQQVAGSCEIAVIDSQSLCAGQGMLIRAAAQAAQTEATAEAVIQAVRAAVKRVYSVYCVGQTDWLRFNRLMSPSHAVLSGRLGIKPFVSLEEGRLSVIGKVQTRAQTIERLVEFLIEFNAFDDAAILQRGKTMGETTRLLQDRLALEFPGQHFPFTMCSAAMMAYLGTAVTGVAVLEKAAEDMDDDF